jgi:hypothetical protein
VGGESTKRFADAMMVFGIGAAAGLASALFAYLRRTVSIELPGQIMERRVFGWLAVAAAIIGAGCFVGALNMARMAVVPGGCSCRAGDAFTRDINTLKSRGNVVSAADAGGDGSLREVSPFWAELPPISRLHDRLLFARGR